MNATYAVVTVIASMVTVLIAVAGLLVALFRRGINEGRLAEILSNLQSLTTDHEARIRVLEAHRASGP